MEEKWNIKEIKTFGDYFRHRKYQTYSIIERSWQNYVNGYLDYPDLTFKDYLLTEWAIFYTPESVLLEISIWLEVKTIINKSQQDQ